MTLPFKPTSTVTPVLAGVGVAAALMWSVEAHAQDPSLPNLIERVSPAVVTVLASSEGSDQPFNFRRRGDNPFEEFFRRFGENDRSGRRGRAPRQGLGSGFVLDPEGYIVTNHHVIEGADYVTVRIPELGEVQAEIVGTDPATDLALLRVETNGALPSVTLGNSDAVRVGEDVVAVGNPFGLGGTVTRGIVSATQRDIQAGPYVDFIQTDAAINRGNSGGPLFNMDGEVIGVNSAIYSPNGGSVGVGFAVASNIVADVVADLRDDGEIERGWLGVSIQRVTPPIAQALGLDAARGALVASVVEDGPSDGTLESGDVILSFAGDAVETSRDLPKLVGRARAGTPVTLEVLRDGREIEREITIGVLERDRRASLDRDRKGRDSDTLGATLARLDPETRDRMGLDPDLRGAVITSVKRGGAADRSGLRVGDVVLRVGSDLVESPRDLNRVLRNAGDNALMLINRRGSEIFVGLSLG
ncbi:MAG: Do family serine endopeptidase [Pseudomonadota bacterium]